MVNFHSYVSLPEGIFKKKTLILRWINHSRITYPPTWAPKTMGVPEVFFLNQHSFWMILGKSEKKSLIWFSRLFGDDFPIKNHDFQGSVVVSPLVHHHLSPPVLVASSGQLGSNLRGLPGDFPATRSLKSPPCLGSTIHLKVVYLNLCIYIYMYVCIYIYICMYRYIYIYS